MDLSYLWDDSINHPGPYEFPSNQQAYPCYSWLQEHDAVFSKLIHDVERLKSENRELKRKVSELERKNSIKQFCHCQCGENGQNTPKRRKYLITSVTNERRSESPDLESSEEVITPTQKAPLPLDLQKENSP